MRSQFHRGTYTSHGSIKKGNRKSEILMRDVELLATAASIHKPKDYTYPWTRINDNWEKVLLNQCTRAPLLVRVLTNSVV